MTSKKSNKLVNLFSSSKKLASIPVVPGNPYDVKLIQNNVKNIQMFGLMFDANKCFLLPYALPGIKKIIKKHKEFSDHEVLVVGHDGSNEDFGGVAIAYHRAKIIAEYLTQNVDAWLAWFKSDKPLKVRWGIREIQLMLSVLPEGEAPHYIGKSSGVRDARTIACIKAFQKSNGLKDDGIPGPKTQKALVEAYIGLTDTTIEGEVKIMAHGCEGKFEDDLSTRGIVFDDRVVEIMLFENKVMPQPKNITSIDGDNEYFEWKNQVIETDFYQFHGAHIQILDTQNRPLRGVKVELEGIVNKRAYTDEQGFVFITGLQNGDYDIYAVIGRKRIKTANFNYPTEKVQYLNQG